MEWRIVLFESKRGEKPIREFIQSLDISSGPKVVHSINLLEQFGPFLKMPHSKKLTKELYELRIRGKEEVRIIYAFNKKDIILLHAFKKKTQKTLQKEIETALNRLDKI